METFRKQRFRIGENAAIFVRQITVNRWDACSRLATPNKARMLNSWWVNDDRGSAKNKVRRHVRHAHSIKEFVSLREKFFCWNRSKAIANGLRDSRTARPIGLRNNSGVTGIESRWSCCKKGI